MTEIRMNLNVPSGKVELNVGQLKIVSFKKGSHLVAQCLEFDVAVQGNDLSELAQRMAHSLATHALIDMHHGRDPLKTLPPAPQHYHTLYNNATPLRQAPNVPASLLPALSATSRAVRDATFAMV